MAGETQKIRTYLAIIQGLFLAYVFFSTDITFAAKRINSNKGTSKGILSPNPNHSAGLQIGNGASNAVVYQRLGILGGALNGGLGVSGDNPTLQLEYNAFIEEGFRTLKLKPKSTYNRFRGRLLPYWGGALHYADGLILRIPVGLTYTMLKDPFNFYSSVNAAFGKTGSEDKAKLRLWLCLGIRLLL